MAALRVAAIDCSAAASRSWSCASSRFCVAAGFARLLRARLAGDRLGAGAGIGERLFVGRMRRVRLLLEAFAAEIVADPPAAFGEDRADARQAPSFDIST
jgi:hypothetical protein